MVYDHIIQKGAEADIEEALDQYNIIRRELSQDLLRKIIKGIDMIKKNPLLFQKVKGK